MFAQPRAVVDTGALIVIALIMALVLVADAAAQSDRSTASDNRATFFPGNATECRHVGFPDAIQLSGGSGTGSTPGRYVSGTVTAGRPTRLQVTITDLGREAGAVILAVVVKGSDGHNVYTNPEFLPPALEPPQDYVSPLNQGGNIADISHWFICYALDPSGPVDPPDPGEDRLRVVKRVEQPVGVPVDPLATEYRVRVTCRRDGEVVKRRTFVYGAGGGSGTTEAGASEIVVPVGARCRVRELNIAALPDGCRVYYEPAVAQNPGVTIPDDGRVVVVVNDCQDVRVQRAGLDIVKRIVGFAPGELPDSFQVNVECTDGTAAQVTVPASGEPGTPRLDGIRVNSQCLVIEETGSLPPGTQVSYTINGSPSPTPGAADFEVVGEERITVTVTNSRSPVPPPPPPPEPPPETPGEPPPTMDPEKTVQRAVVRAGGRVRFTLEVRNRGRGVGRGVVVCDRLPGDLTVVSAPGSRFRNGRICWRIARLMPLGVRRFTLIARADRQASGGSTNVEVADAPRTRARTARVRVIIRPRRGLAPGAVTG